MTILFSPSGALNIAHDPSELPETSDQNSSNSGAMTRCKNLRINQQGIAKTRDGSTKLNTTAISSVNWLEVQGGTRYAFGGGSIYENESSIASGLTDSQWCSIKYNAFNDTTQEVFAFNGTDRKRISGSTVSEWGIAAPADAPTFVTGQGDTLTGEYNAKYTYVRKVGSVVVAESNPSPEGISKVIASGSLSVSLTQPTDSQVTHIRLYRTVAGGALYLYDQEVPIGLYTYGYTYDWEATDAYFDGTGWNFTVTDPVRLTENTYSWEERSIDLSTTVSHGTYTEPFGTIDSVQDDSELGDEVSTDHDRPPLGSFIFGPAYDGTCFILYSNLLYYCKPKQPEYWPATYYIEVSTPQFPLKTGVFHNGQPYVCSANEIYYIQGTGNGTFFPLPMKAKTGAQSIQGAVSVDGKGIFHTGPDGIYLFGSGADTKITEDSFEPIFRGEDTNGIPGVADMSTSWLFGSGNYIYFGYRSSGYRYPTNILVTNLNTNRTSYYNYNDGNAVEIRAIRADETNKRIVIGDNLGYVRVIESTSYTDDSGAAISFDLQSKDYQLQTRKHFPRWVKYDVDASSSTSCTGELIVDGSSYQTHTITGNRDTRRRLTGVGNGNRAAIRISGSGPVSIYAAESE